MGRVIRGGLIQVRADVSLEGGVWASLWVALLIALANVVLQGLLLLLPRPDNVLLLAGEKEGTAILLDKLAGKQIENGSLKDATVSVVGSTGEALAIETTALAVMAWLKNPSFAANVEKGIRYLADQCKAGRFGSNPAVRIASPLRSCPSCPPARRLR